jgi:hypothetical protein
MEVEVDSAIVYRKEVNNKGNGKVVEWDKA